MCEYFGSRSIAATPENSEKEERECVSVLRALCVLAHIKDNRTDDDQALDDVGHVIIDLQHNQAVVDNAEDQDACQNTDTRQIPPVWEVPPTVAAAIASSS